MTLVDFAAASGLGTNRSPHVISSRRACKNQKEEYDVGAANDVPRHQHEVRNATHSPDHDPDKRHHTEM